MHSPKAARVALGSYSRSALRPLYARTLRLVRFLPNILPSIVRPSRPTARPSGYLRARVGVVSEAVRIDRKDTREPRACAGPPGGSEKSVQSRLTRPAQRVRAAFTAESPVQCAT